MSEEEKKGKHIAVRFISIITLVASITFVLSGLLAVHTARAVWVRKFSGADVDFDFTIDVGFFILKCFWSFWPFIILIGFVLPIVTVFIERNILLRLLPLVFFIVGFFINAVACVILFLILMGG